MIFKAFASLRLPCSLSLNSYRSICFQNPLQLSRRAFLFSTSSDSYYNWNNPADHQRAIQQQYILSDLLKGCQFLSNRDSELTLANLTFLLYVCTLFPNQLDQLMPTILKYVHLFQQESTMLESLPIYFSFMKALRQLRESNGSKWLEHLSPHIRRRINLCTKYSSLPKIYRVLSICGFENMGNLEEIFQHFKSLLYTNLKESNFLLSSQLIRCCVSIYHLLPILDKELSDKPFFSEFPAFQNQQTSFCNLLKVLQSFLSSNFVNFISLRDLLDLHTRINQCGHLVTSKAAVAELNKYSQHLVIIQKPELINFRNILKSI